MSKRIVVFTGAGVSAESGLGTFRDSDGLWEHYRIEDVCTHEAWLRNPQLCVDFYNARRKDTLAAQPNAAHVAIAKLQAENATDYGLIMAGAAVAAVPIIIVFVIFQKYFTQGITMGAVKG